MTKPIVFSRHALEQLSYRGAAEKEVQEAIQTCRWLPAELGRLECRKDFGYNQDWHKKFYQTKQVHPIFIEEAKEIVIVTVYVYFF